MIWNTVNVLTISCAGKIAGKLAWKILNELGVCWVGIGLVLCPFPCDVFVMYWLRTPLFAPSVSTPENWTVISDFRRNAAMLSLERAKSAALEINLYIISKGGRELISWLSALIHTYIYLYNVAAFNAR